MINKEECINSFGEGGEIMLQLENMFVHLANEKLISFKSQQINDPDLDVNQKIDISRNLFYKNPAQFIARFGQHLITEHLDLFENLSQHNEIYASYEIDFYIKKFRRMQKKNQIDIKNRRYEALKKLIEEGTYFSESEMRARNPLLYYQLVGRYLTEKEIDERDEKKKSHTSLLSLVMSQIDRDEMEDLMEQQVRHEESIMEEEEDSSDDEEKEQDNSKIDNKKSMECKLEEEEDDESDKDCESNDDDEDGCRVPSGCQLNIKEKQLLREEFVATMYNNFLEGKDVEFDYSQVDTNPEYECLDVQDRDEEDKYFDSESPEIVANDNSQTIQEDEGEDELDVFMKNLYPEPQESAFSQLNLRDKD